MLGALALLSLLVAVDLTVDANAQAPDARSPAEKGSVVSNPPATPTAPDEGAGESWNVELGQARFVNARMSRIIWFLRTNEVRVCWEKQPDAVPGNFGKCKRDGVAHSKSVVV